MAKSLSKKKSNFIVPSFSRHNKKRVQKPEKMPKTNWKK